MSSYLRPRRGKKSTAETQLTSSTPLKRGEVFFEVPDTGVGTGNGKIKMGDGVTGYSALPYFLDNSGNGGHTILDPDGDSMTQQPNMQFADAHLFNDSQNNKTVIEVIKEVADIDLPTDDGIYVADDDNDVPIDISNDKVEISIDGVKTWGQLLNALYALANLNKITHNAKIVIDRVTSKLIYRLSYVDNENYSFMQDISTSTYIEDGRIVFSNDSSFYDYTTNTGSHSYTNNVPSNIAWKLILYYGTSSAIVELNTDANHCIMSDGVTSVEEALVFEDITSKCTLYSGLSSTVVLYNKTLKMVRVQGIIASGTPNATTIITLPNTIKANGVQLLAQKYDTSDGKTITCVITDNSSSIVTEYSLSANAGVAQIITAFIMCK